MQLSYFKARFSSRWLGNKRNTLNEIQILPTNDKNFNYNQIQFRFNCNDLQLLLKCIESSKIPSNQRLELNELESLLYCHDYLNPQSNDLNRSDTSFTITQSTIVTYFRNCIESIDKAERDQMLSDCTHHTIRDALLQLSNEYKTILDESQSKLVYNSYSSVNNTTKNNNINSFRNVNGSN